MKINYIYKIYTVGNDTYICKAELGRKINENYWAITKYNNDTVMFPLNIELETSDNFEFIAENYLTYTYSF